MLAGRQLPAGPSSDRCTERGSRASYGGASSVGRWSPLLLRWTRWPGAADSSTSHRGGSHTARANFPKRSCGRRQRGRLDVVRIMHRGRAACSLRCIGGERGLPVPVKPTWRWSTPQWSLPCSTSARGRSPGQPEGAQLPSYLWAEGARCDGPARPHTARTASLLQRLLVGRRHDGLCWPGAAFRGKFVAQHRRRLPAQPWRRWAERFLGRGGRDWVCGTRRGRPSRQPVGLWRHLPRYGDLRA